MESQGASQTLIGYMFTELRIITFRTVIIRKTKT
jgi:hypothetical protein